MMQLDGDDISGPVTGYFLSTILLILYGINVLTNEFGMFILGDCTFVYAILGILILIVAGLCLKNWYLMSGYMFLLISIATICLSLGKNVWSYEFGDAANVVLCIAIIMIACMCYRAGEDVQMAVNILLAAMVLLSMSLFDHMSVVLGLIAVVAGCLMAYLCYDRWSVIQDMDAEYEGRLPPLKKG
jgi:hypothetical protein